MNCVISLCYSLNEENKAREINGLIEAIKKFKLSSGTILTFDQGDNFLIEGREIKVVPVWQWLLED